VHGSLALFITIGGTCFAFTAIIIFVKTAVLPVIHMAKRFDKTWETLSEIADAFTPNGHLSLPEAVDEVRATQQSHGTQLDEIDTKVTGIRHDVIDVAGLATLTTALGTVPTIVGAMTSVVEEVKGVRAQLGDIAHSVATGNDQTLGEMADAAESRRVGLLGIDDRTTEESAHLSAIPEPPRPDHKENP
jgi:hypothetical protein